ncbi:unnamed protein product [Arabidopsis arenosa]|uniref:Uncharacterized protein n=1 Tax=Arabidopsis arenosa TaxID=38785 RepID=A0A8S1ZL84_ARAAE|nr:unnamed protein product [Arabidopsis arenosa]
MKSEGTSGVLRLNVPVPPAVLTYFPYGTGSGSGKEDMKQDVIRLGVELSVYVSESMFLLCDDIRTMLCFCATLWRCVMPYQDHVLQRLLLVMHYVYSTYIKPKNLVYHDGGNSVQWGLIRTTWELFVDGIIVLHRLVLVLSRKDCSFDDRVLSSAFAKYKQVLKNLEVKLSSTKDVSEANGFVRETIESNIFDLWKSLFDEEAGEAAPQVIRTRISTDLFTPLLCKPIHREMLALSPHSPYILGFDFAKQELKEEVVRLGVELSLYVAESMYLLSDDIRSMLRFCLKLWRDAKGDVLIPDSPVVERLLLAIHYVYSKDIKPKHGGVYQNDGKSVQWELIRTTWENFDAGIRDLDRLVLILRGEGTCFDGREFTSRIEEALKKVDDKLRCAKAVSEAKGFAREAMETDIGDLWKSLFDKEAKEVMKHEIFWDLFLPLCMEAVPH